MAKKPLSWYESVDWAHASADCVQNMEIAEVLFFSLKKLLIGRISNRHEMANSIDQTNAIH